ncbi:MAG: 4-(cytidine 5'-diphospho)-2-C-methyl-D-erythritol kinase [Desulfatitalea sp.]|nr:4-(cytidine 5'-diphospho)-2-C-methyl-D-erythritol kinase [Desulfatitalea sp.]NNJ99576.1 4-(cytidine 5'-diphospho)-2-C-methyl-D-erythritol kinase [Desulfatitalea sp.]
MHASNLDPINSSPHPQRVELLAPAKINLFLYVIDRRVDGYHELYSLMCPVALYDRLTIETGPPVDQFTYHHPDLPQDASNLVRKAAHTFKQALSAETDIPPIPVAIDLVKQIPISAGLGGGSSDAAATLKGLNQIHGKPFAASRLHRLALSVGADVPFFIDGRPAIAQGVGERLSAFDAVPAFWTVLIYPGYGFSTAQVFRNLNLPLTKSKKNLRNVPFIKETFKVPNHLHNDLEKGVGIGWETIQRNKTALMNKGALGALMTGSGSTVFGLFTDKATAEKAAKCLGKAHEQQVFVAKLLSRG